MRIWGDPPLLYLPTAQADRGNYPNSYLQNFANDWTPRAVEMFCFEMEQAALRFASRTAAEGILDLPRAVGL